MNNRCPERKENGNNENQNMHNSLCSADYVNTGWLHDKKQQAKLGDHA